MQAIVRQAMEEGALGVASALIYPPGSFADTDELIALARAAAEYDGMYISHLRSEGALMLEALDELITIAREANIRAEIYHLKSSGQSNWPLFDEAVAMVEQARAEGLSITADVYTYPAGSTGLNADNAAMGTGGWVRGLSGADEDPAFGGELPERCSRSPTSGRTCTWVLDRPTEFSWWVSRTRNSSP